MKLDKEFLAPEAELANLCPRKRVDFRLILEDEDSHVSDGKLQCNALVVLQQINHGVTGLSFAAIKMKRRRAIYCCIIHAAVIKETHLRVREKCTQ